MGNLCIIINTYLDDIPSRPATVNLHREAEDNSESTQDEVPPKVIILI